MSPLETSSTAPAEGGLYTVDCDEARQLADAIGIWQDLDYSVNEFARLEEAIKSDPRDSVAERAYWTSAIVHYGRCFNPTGRRFALPPTIFGRYAAPDGAAEEHAFLMNLMDKDLRHPVSGFEQSHVGVLIAPAEDGAPRILRAAAMYARHHTRTADGAHKARLHVERLRDYVRTVVQLLHDEVERVARQLSINDIVKGGQVRLDAPPVDAAGKPRKGIAVRSIPGLD
jgi:hypothetical protein